MNRDSTTLSFKLRIFEYLDQHEQFIFRTVCGIFFLFCFSSVLKTVLYEISWLFLSFLFAICFTFIVIFIFHSKIIKRKAFSSTISVFLVFLFLLEFCFQFPTLFGFIALPPLQVDTREKSEVVLSLRAKGVDAYPAVFPSLFINSPIQHLGNDVISFGGIANATTVLCSEAGPMVTYESDELGFRNPSGTFDDNLDVVVLGDSYAHGACVSKEEHFMTAIRGAFPKSASLGMFGNGPLIELAALRSLLASRKVSNVVWLYYEANDMKNLKSELRSQFLSKFLFDENLPITNIFFQQEIQEELKEYVKEQYTIRPQKIFELRKRRSRDFCTGIRGAFQFCLSLKSFPYAFIELFTLTTVATILKNNIIELWPGVIFSMTKDPEPVSRPRRLSDNEFSEALGTFEVILKKAKKYVNAQEGRLYFVYLPSGTGWGRAWREKVISIPRNLGIESVDLAKEFESSPNTPELYSYRNGGHYSAKGYKKLSNEILNLIMKR